VFDKLMDQQIHNDSEYLQQDMKVNGTFADFD